MSIADWTHRGGGRSHYGLENPDDSRHGRLDMAYGDLDDPGSQQAASTSSRPYPGSIREVENGATSDTHEACNGGAEDLPAMREGTQDGAPDGRCSVGEDHQGLLHGAPAQVTSAVSHAAGDDAAETCTEHARALDHCSNGDHQAAEADNQEPANSTHAERDGAEEEHEAHQNQGEHDRADDADDARDEQDDADGEDHDGDTEDHNRDGSTHRGRGDGADTPEDEEHDHEDGAHEGRGETDDDTAHEACDGSSVIAGDDMLVFKDRSEWGNDDKHVGTDGNGPHDFGTLWEHCADDDGLIEHGAHAGDHALDMTLENICPTSQSDHGLLIL